jgi:hypothetical protein
VAIIIAAIIERVIDRNAVVFSKWVCNSAFLKKQLPIAELGGAKNNPYAD